MDNRYVIHTDVAVVVIVLAAAAAAAATKAGIYVSDAAAHYNTRPIARNYVVNQRKLVIRQRIRLQS